MIQQSERVGKHYALHIGHRNVIWKKGNCRDTDYANRLRRPDKTTHIFKEEFEITEK